MDSDVIVVGGGVVGAAVAMGLAKRNLAVTVLDGSDTDFSAARANFGLVWAQGKGDGKPEYQRLTQSSIRLWPAFTDELRQASRIDVQYENGGGLGFCLGETEFEMRAANLARLQRECGDTDCATTMLERSELERMLPKVRLGADVTGASYCSHDGAANPLLLLRALHAALSVQGVRLLSNRPVTDIVSQAGGFRIDSTGGPLCAESVVIAAGLGSADLAKRVGIDVELRPSRGQLLVTERVDRILPLPCSGLRQSREGTMLIGSTQEDVGLDASTTFAATVQLSRRAVRVMPDLAEVSLVRQWSGLRIMSGDGYPVYVESETYPGAFLLTCHSAVTLAPVHSGPVADAVARRTICSEFSEYHPRRFLCSAN